MDQLSNKKLLVAVTLLALTLLLAGSLDAPALAQGTAFYVDCSQGSDGNGTQTSPWNSLTPVNNTSFAPGDSILFKRGTACSGQLWPKGSGVDGVPIHIGAYDTGALPQIVGGSNDATLKLFNQEYWEIEQIEVVGGTTFGIFVDGDGSALLHHIHITNVVVRDVWGGNMDVKTTGLVVLGYDWTQHFEDVLIEGVTAYNTDMWAGIVVTGKGYKWQPTRSNNVVIRNNTVHNTYGDGIIVFSSNNVLIEHNVAFDTGNEPTETIGTPNSIWTWDCSDCVVQYNEAYLASSPSWDGGAFDIDYYSSRTTVQYNYGHDNDAYCLAIFSTDGTLTDNTIRYNICSNNAREGSLAPDRNADMYYAVWASGMIDQSKVYNNTFYWNPANPDDHFAVAGFDLWRGCCFTGSNWFMNNIIYSESPKLVHMGLNEHIIMDYNLYWYTGAGDPEFRWGHRRYSGFTAFQNGSGQEANGIYADPGLNDPSYHDIGFPVSAFTLQKGSPAIGAGADLVALGYVADMGLQDFFGNAIPSGGAYDIGAHEYSGGPVPTLTPTAGPSPTATEPPPPTPTPGSGTIVHVEDIYTTDAGGTPQDVFSAGTRVYFRVLVLSGSGQPVRDANVSVEIIGPDSGTMWTPSATTGADGWALFNQKTNKPNPKGVYTIRVTDVALSGRTYDPLANIKDSHPFALE